MRSIQPVPCLLDPLDGNEPLHRRQTSPLTREMEVERKHLEKDRKNEQQRCLQNAEPFDLGRLSRTLAAPLLLQRVVAQSFPVFLSAEKHGYYLLLAFMQSLNKSY